MSEAKNQELLFFINAAQWQGYEDGLLGRPCDPKPDPEDHWTPMPVAYLPIFEQKYKETHKDGKERRERLLAGKPRATMQPENTHDHNLEHDHEL